MTLHGGFTESGGDLPPKQWEERAGASAPPRSMAQSDLYDQTKTAQAHHLPGSHLSDLGLGDQHSGS